MSINDHERFGLSNKNDYVKTPKFKYSYRRFSLSPKLILENSQRQGLTKGQTYVST
jgi:hypothetical protein